MRFRTVLLAFFLTAIFVLPVAAQAGGIPFLGPIIPQDQNKSTCPAGWGMLIEVINNLISFFITLAIVFVAPLMLAYAGFLFVTNPVNASGKEKAKKVLLNTVIGIVIALAGWMIVDAIMVVLYNPEAKSGGTKLEVWSSLIRSGGAPSCLDQKGANKDDKLNQAVPQKPLDVVYRVPFETKFTFDSAKEVNGGIREQVPHASPPLRTLLDCMAAKVPTGVGRISSISETPIVLRNRTFEQCASGAITCTHAVNSCHYGGRKCVGSSYAVDFGDGDPGTRNLEELKTAAIACGGAINPEKSHLHVSVGAAAGCGCDTGLDD